MSKRNLWGTPKGWTDIGSDLSWSDHGGKWAKKVEDKRTFYVLDFTNMWEVCGQGAKNDGCEQYLCEVKMVDLDEIDIEQLSSALGCCGLRFTAGWSIEDEQGNILTGPGFEGRYDWILVEACVSYGAYAPLASFGSDHHPLNLRGKARQYAERLILEDSVSMRRHSERVEKLLNRPVNRIGSTAREYMKGDLTSALDRGPFNVEKNLMRKLSGLIEKTNDRK
jgi:hypothetical protein